MSRALLLLILFAESILAADDYQKKMTLFGDYLRVCSQEEAEKIVQEKMEQDVLGFTICPSDVSLLEEKSSHYFLEQIVLKEGHALCRKTQCHDKIPCQGIAKRLPQDPIGEGKNASLHYQVSWALEGDDVVIKEIVCTSEIDDRVDWEWVEDIPQLFEEAPTSQSWFSFSGWWPKRSAPVEEVKPAIEQRSTFNKVYTVTIAAASTFYPAVQTFVETNIKDADLLDPKTYSPTGQLYDFFKTWLLQAAAMGIEALEADNESPLRKQPEIYLDDILTQVSLLLKNNQQDLTANQYTVLNKLTDEAYLELNKFKMKKTADVNKTLSQVTSALPMEEPQVVPDPKASSINLVRPNAIPPFNSIRNTPTPAKPQPQKLTLREATASSQKVKAAARPTLLDLKDEPNLRIKFEFLRQILEFPFKKQGIQTEDLLERHKTVPKRGSADYEQTLWAFAQNVMDDSNAVDSKRTLSYYYAEPGNGKTSGIEEMLVGWLDLPLCKIGHQEIKERNTQEFPSVTDYLKYKIIDCLRVSFINKSTGDKIRNGIVLFDDFDRILNTALAESKSSKDRENFFLLLKDLSDPSQKEMNAKLKVQLAENSVHYMEFPVRISDLYFFITANSVPPEFDEKTAKSETINTVLSRIQLYQVPYADREQRMRMLLDMWQPIENKMNKHAKGKFIINHDLCVEALAAIVAKDGEALDNMNGNMGVRGLIELFRRFKGTMQTRKLQPNICKLNGEGIDELPFNVEDEAKSVGEYKKEQTANLRAEAFNRRVDEFLHENQDKLDKLSQSEIAKTELTLLMDKSRTCEQREESRQKLEDMINPIEPKKIDDQEVERITDLLVEELDYLGEDNLTSILQIANITLKNIIHGGKENISNSLVFLKQESERDLGIIAKIAEVIALPYCKIDEGFETIAVRTPLVWKEYQKEKQQGTVYLRLSNNSIIPATWDETKRIYTGYYSGKTYIAGKPIDGQNSSQTYFGMEISDIELNRLTSTDSPWIDECERQLKQQKQSHNLKQVLVLIDRTKQKIGFDSKLITALMESTNGMTRRSAGASIDMRKATIVVSANSRNITAEHLAEIEKYNKIEKLVPIELYPLSPKERLHFAERYLENQLKMIAKDLNLDEPLELDRSEKVALHFIAYLDLTAYWQTKEKSNVTIIIDPLRDMVTALSSKVRARKTEILRIRKKSETFSNLFNELIGKWKLYYQSEHRYPIKIPQVYRDQSDESFGAENWQESVMAWTERDIDLYKLHRAEKFRLRQEQEEKRKTEELRLKEEQERQRTEELKLRQEEEKRKTEEIRLMQQEIQTYQQNMY